MSNKKVGSDLERKFSSIETWEEFLTKWKAIDTEQEAVGLLYGGVDVAPFGSRDFSEKGEIIRERIAFYLELTKYSNETVAITAQQIIIKHWLKRLHVSSVGLYSGFLEATNMVLEFLQNPTDSILKSPYPRFVSEYLLPLHEEWRHGRHSDYHGGKAYQALQGSTKLIVRALCAWGLSYVLARDGLRPETIPIIKEFLDERGYQTGEVFFEISGYGQPLSDLSTPTSAKSVNYTAACAFLKLKFWVGGGFTANFIRTSPLKYFAE